MTGKPQAEHLRRGRQAERHARDFLNRRKLQLITENYRTCQGEIDLIMRDGNTLVFIEVRYRHNHAYGNALESVNRDKQRKIIRTAHAFLQTHRHDGEIRFDVITFDGAMTTPKWVKNAFDVEW